MWWVFHRLLKKDWPPMNADERGLKSKMIIGVDLRSSAARSSFQRLHPGGLTNRSPGQQAHDSACDVLQRQDHFGRA